MATTHSPTWLRSASPVHRRQAGGVDLEQGHVGALVHADHPRLEVALVGEANGHFGGAIHHVGVGQHEAVGATMKLNRRPLLDFGPAPGRRDRYPACLAPARRSGAKNRRTDRRRKCRGGIAAGEALGNADVHHRWPDLLDQRRKIRQTVASDWAPGATGGVSAGAVTGWRCRWRRGTGMAPSCRQPGERQRDGGSGESGSKRRQVSCSAPVFTDGGRRVAATLFPAEQTLTKPGPIRVGCEVATPLRCAIVVALYIVNHYRHCRGPHDADRSSLPRCACLSGISAMRPNAATSASRRSVAIKSSKKNER